MLFQTQQAMKGKMKKIFKKISKGQSEPTGRITNETVSEHRERILAGGRRFKYPIQYSRHKLVINAVILSAAALVVLAFFGYWQLYQTQATDSFIYRITRILPLPVASVDGESVRYSDYLMRYRPQEHFERSGASQVDIDSESGERLLNSYRRGAMNQVEADTYAKKLAKDMKITVSEVEIDQVVASSRKTPFGSISQENYDASLQDKLGYSPDEYRMTIYQSLLRQKVAYAVDKNALEVKDAVGRLIEANFEKNDFAAIAKKININDEKKIVVGGSGLVRKNNQDGGLTDAASKLKVGEISGVIESTTGDGYYYVKLLEMTSIQLSYEYIKIPLAEFDSQMKTLRDQGKIKEYIKIPELETVEIGK